MDSDGNGEIEFEEFFSWWKDENGQRNQGTGAKLLKAKLKSQRFFADITGSTALLKAKKAFIHRAKLDALVKTRHEYRQENPAPYVCSECNMSFPLLADLNEHVALERCGRKDLLDLEKIRREFMSIIRIRRIPRDILS